MSILKHIENGELDLRNADCVLYFEIDGKMFPVQRLFSTGKDSLRVRYVTGGDYRVPIIKKDRLIVRAGEHSFFMYAHRVHKTSGVVDGVPFEHIDLYDLSVGACTP